MALSVSPFLATSAAPVSNAGVAPAVPIPDNCHTIIVLNTTAVAGLVGQQTVGTLLVAGANAMSVPAGGSLTLAVGTFTQRGTMDAAVQPNSGLVYGSVGAGITLQVLYLCTFGPV
jgi:hypothetical protein